MKRDAIISVCGKYRYGLSRNIGRGDRFVCFIMLNPSTADAEKDNPTIRRCISFARGWGIPNLEVVNLFAWRTPYPGEFRNVDDPVGPENDQWIRRAMERASVIVAAWGDRKIARRRAKIVMQIAQELWDRKRKILYCFGVTQSGGPRHPLYVRSGTQLKPYRLDTTE